MLSTEGELDYYCCFRNTVLTVKSASAGTVQFLGCKNLNALLD